MGSRPPELPVVLVVDDDEELRTLMDAHLRAQHRVLLAESGEEALAILGRDAVDAVLLDVGMPRMDGFEACRRIRALRADRFLPVLMFTSLSDQEDRTRGLEAGADDFIAKTVDKRELLLRLGVFLRIRAQDEQIRRQLEDLHALSALKDDLVSLIVHDLRSPLAGVLGLLESILRGPLSDETLREDLAAALDAGEGIRRMVNDMLDVKPLETGELRLKRETIDAREVVHSAFTSVSAESREKNVAVVLEDGEPVLVPADAKLVRRALTNLLLNAIQYSRRGGRVSVAVRKTADGNAVEFDVSDRGDAVPPALHGSMFEKFGTVQSRKNAARRGYGLGHYFVNLVARAHGGSITVQDGEGGGGGATMRLSLPTNPVEP